MRTRSRWIPLGLGLVAAAAATALLLAQRGSGETLTRQSLERARNTWRDRGPGDYALGVRVRGVQEGDHHIVVANGQVKKMTTGGAPVREGAQRYWSVEGMFEFLDEELRRAERDTTPEIILQVEFDADLGYPRRFLRHVTGQVRDIGWEIYSFEPSR